MPVPDARWARFAGAEGRHLDKSALEKKLVALRTKQSRLDKALKSGARRGLLELFVELVPAALNVERCSIFILDPATEKVWLECGTGLEQRQVSVPKADSLVGRVISSGRYEIETDMDNLVGSHGVVDMQTGYLTRNALCVPVKGVSKVKVAGAIEVLNKKVGGFSERDVALLQKVAGELQAGIENIYLRRELTQLSAEMGKRIRLLEGGLEGKDSGPSPKD